MAPREVHLRNGDRIMLDVHDGMVRVAFYGKTKTKPSRHGQQVLDDYTRVTCKALTLEDAMEGALEHSRHSYRRVCEYIRLTEWGDRLPSNQMQHV